MNTLPPDPAPVHKDLRHIDLKKHLDLPFGSLSPHDPVPGETFHSYRQDEDAPSPLPSWLFLAFTILSIGGVIYHCLTR